MITVGNNISLMTIDEACSFLGIKKTTFYALKEKYKIKGYGVGAKVLYRERDIKNLIMIEKPKKNSGRRPKNTKENEQ